MSEKMLVSVDLELDKDLYHALEWYVRTTQYWVSNDHKESSIKSFIEYCVKWVLKAEARDPQMAYDFIKDTMSHEFGLIDL